MISVSFSNRLVNWLLENKFILQISKSKQILFPSPISAEPSCFWSELFPPRLSSGPMPWPALPHLCLFFQGQMSGSLCILSRLPAGAASAPNLCCPPTATNNPEGCCSALSKSTTHMCQFYTLPLTQPPQFPAKMPWFPGDVLASATKTKCRRSPHQVLETWAALRNHPPSPS